MTAVWQQTPYQGYAYAYPHKTAYRPLPEPAPLCDVWKRERREALFLYIHVPFCEMRCGFCNLFTQAKPRAELAARYLDVLEQEAQAVCESLGDARFARLAIGGGTPTFLDVAGLERLFQIARALGADLNDIPISVETSPATATPEKLTLLRQWGVTRISIGVQSFVEAETAAVARPQPSAEVETALANIAAVGFPSVNIDLIYGLPGQSVASWIDSVECALQHTPQEIYIYPLYVRPGTSLGRSRRSWDDLRLACYREARAMLLQRGYEQTSMRMFRLPVAVETGPIYCCQEDGMVGLGCGARSYTRGLHYSREYAVGAAGVRAILADYLAQPTDDFRLAHHGFRLNADEQRRRYLIQSLLQASGLDLAAYGRRFGTDVTEDFPQLAELAQQNLVQRTTRSLRLTERGLERSDAIGPWFYSAQVVELMNAYEQR